MTRIIDLVMSTLSLHTLHRNNVSTTVERRWRALQGLDICASGPDRVWRQCDFRECEYARTRWIDRIETDIVNRGRRQFHITDDGRQVSLHSQPDIDAAMVLMRDSPYFSAGAGLMVRRGLAILSAGDSVADQVGYRCGPHCLSAVSHTCLDVRPTSYAGHPGDSIKRPVVPVVPRVDGDTRTTAATHIHPRVGCLCPCTYWQYQRLWRLVIFMEGETANVSPEP